ncbi:polysaccharide deacetylase family protein [Chloroflexota bacterium]
MDYSSITLDSLLDLRNGSFSVSKRPIIITFDDGYKDCVEHAVPILSKYNLSATFFLVVGSIGSTSSWTSTHGLNIPIMDWKDVHHLKSSDFQIGSHTMSHPKLVELSLDNCHKEVYNSRISLEDHLGCEIRHFCYPFGFQNESVRKIVVESGYSTACSARIGLSDLYDDAFTLRRIEITGYGSLFDFICKLKFGRTLKDYMRRKVWEIKRYAPFQTL